MLTALTRDISSSFHACEVTHVERVVIDLDRARAQHDAYEWALVELECTVRRLDSADDLPDAVFIEDTALVLPEGAIITRPGAESRRGETPAVAGALARFGMPLREIAAPGTLDGGDVLRVGRRLFVGNTGRTNAEGISQLRRILKPFGYSVEAVPVKGCLHLKSAVTTVAPDTLLINRDWVSAAPFTGLTLIDVDPDEPHAANALLVDATVVHPSAYTRTRQRLEERGLRVRPVDVDELAKAEGGVTCCCLLVEM